MRRKKRKPFLINPERLDSTYKEVARGYRNLKKIYSAQELFEKPTFFQKLFWKKPRLKRYIKGRKIKCWKAVRAGDFPEDWEYIPIFYKRYKRKQR